MKEQFDPRDLHKSPQDDAIMTDFSEGGKLEDMVEKGKKPKDDDAVVTDFLEGKGLEDPRKQKM